MESPTVSVVMPTLNNGAHIKRAVGSILEQSFSDLQIIIVDDGSSDGTISQIEEFTDERIQLVQRADKTGLASARNEGLRRSLGRYVAVHDGDDWSHPDRFRNQVEYLKTNPDVAVVGTGAYLVDEMGTIRARRHVLESPSRADIETHTEFVHGSVMMRRDVLERIGGYDEWFALAEDYDLWLRIADECAVRNIDEPLYYFRQYDGSKYSSNLEAIKLYHLLALWKSQSKLSDDLRSRIDERGIETVYGLLSTDERQWYHGELAKENLRYGKLNHGHQHAKRLLATDRTQPLAYALLALTYTTPFVTTFVARTYRRLLNAKIELQNRR